jgi:hypothetical protein
VAGVARPRFWETLHELEPARRLSPEHEARWLSLAGFALRPGYGLAVDDWRVGQTWKLAAQGLAFPKHEQNRAEWWVLWRRLAGGLTAGQQAAVADPLVADWRTYVRKQGVGVRGRQAAFQFGPAESAEVWRLLGSLELLRPATKLDWARCCSTGCRGRRPARRVTRSCSRSAGSARGCRSTAR